MKAFIIAEMLGITYFEVITHALIPAVIVYLSLFWISHLEASKLGLKGMNKKEIPDLKSTFFSGAPEKNVLFKSGISFLFIPFKPSLLASK